MNTAETIADTLLTIEAVTLSPEKPYTWSSGLRSPIYCDNRLLLSFPAERKAVYLALAAAVKEMGAEVVAGTATAGIPHAAWVAEELGLPMIYVRSSSKGHGKQNKIEGKLLPDAKVVIIEDLISTGGSAFQAAEAVEESGGIVVGIQAIFTYELQAASQEIQKKSYPVQSLTTFRTLAQRAIENKKISKDSWNSLAFWQEDPAAWSKEASVNG